MSSISLNNLKPASGSVKGRKRIARGQGSGSGGTAGRGHKGAKSRSGYKSKRGFEGGQMPLQRRLPKFGFKNPFRKEFEVINLGRLQEYVDKYKLTAINHAVLLEHGIITKNDKVKILGTGELKSKLDIKVNAVSESAKKAIEAAGGTVNLV